MHTWLPEAHVEASTEGSIILAGLLLKLGLFGICKFLIPIFPEASIYYSPLVSMIALYGIIYISFIIFVQTDIKKIIAYSSIIHMNFSLLGIFSGNFYSIQGSIYLMFIHGFISSALFIIIGYIYLRHGSRLIYYYQGLKTIYPIFSFFFFLFILGNFGFPGTGGFTSEFLIILGIFSKNFYLGFFSLIGPLLCSIYSLYLYLRIFEGNNFFNIFIGYNDHYNYYKNFFYPNKKKKLYYLNVFSFEFYILFIFLFFLIITGLFPNIFLNYIHFISYKLFILLN